LVYVLASDKELQSSLRREIQNCFPEDLLKNENGDVQVGAVLESLPLLNGICNETMRLYPTVPLSMRTPNKDTTILGHSVPKGTELYIIPWAINRCRELWGPTAHEFRPERWIDADTGKPNNTGGAISNYAVMTFLQGVHMCIGQSFAKAELRALVVTLVRAFEIGLAYPERPVIPAGIITTKPEGGMWIKLKRVEECFYAQD
jgi:cytochrome P450